MSSSRDLAYAHSVVEDAWRDLPAQASSLLESIRAHAWEVTDRSLGTYADDLRRSGGFDRLSDADRGRADRAAGIWLPEPRLEDVAAGKRLLESVPPALAGNVRSSGYLRREYTHEIVAEIYAMLMLRRRLDGTTEKPSWLSQEIYQLVRRVAGWNQ